MRHTISPELLDLLRKHIGGGRGAGARFCERNNVTRQDLSKILSGKKKVVYSDLYLRLISEIPELSKEYTDLLPYVTNTKWRVNYVASPGVCVSANETAGSHSGSMWVDSIEQFRAGLIGALIDSDLPPEDLQTVLKIVKNFKLDDNKNE